MKIKNPTLSHISKIMVASLDWVEFDSLAIIIVKHQCLTLKSYPSSQLKLDKCWANTECQCWPNVILFIRPSVLTNFQPLLNPLLANVGRVFVKSVHLATLAQHWYEKCFFADVGLTLTGLLWKMCFWKLWSNFIKTLDRESQNSRPKETLGQRHFVQL